MRLFAGRRRCLRANPGVDGGQSLLYDLGRESRPSPQWLAGGAEKGGDRKHLDLELWEKSARDALALAREKQDEALELKGRVREASVGAGQDYHPFDLQSGARREAHQVEQALAFRFEALKAAADTLSLPEPARERLLKSERVVPKMVSTIAFVHQKLVALFATAELTERERQVSSGHLVGAQYIRLAEGKVQKAAERSWPKR